MDTNTKELIEYLMPFVVMAFMLWVVFKKG